jgi:hypothetical protein
VAISRSSSALWKQLARGSGGEQLLWARGYAAKEVSFGVGAHASMLQGVNDLADAVKVTMGPKVHAPSSSLLLCVVGDRHGFFFRVKEPTQLRSQLHYKRPRSTIYSTICSCTLATNPSQDTILLHPLGGWNKNKLARAPSHGTFCYFAPAGLRPNALRWASSKCT